MNLRRFGGLLALGIGLTMAGLLAEAALRLYTALAETELSASLRADPLNVLVEPHGVAGYRPVPGAVIQYANGARATTNAMGYRGQPVSVAKRDGTVRIVMLGGSTTHGWGVDDDQTIAHYMNELLAEAYPGRAFETVNLAFDGYDSYQLLERLRSDGLRLQPDIVIVNTGINDVRNARFGDLTIPDSRTLLWRGELERLRHERERGGPSVWTGIKHLAFVARIPAILRSRIGNRGNPVGGLVDGDSVHADALDYFSGNVRSIVRLARERGVAVLLSVAPSALRSPFRPEEGTRISYWLETTGATQAYRDSLGGRLEEVAGTATGPVAFVTHEQLGPEHFLDDVHLTAAGNRQLAADFVAALAPLLPPGGTAAAAPTSVSRGRPAGR